MPELFKEKYKILGWYQIIGGTLGEFFTVYLFLLFKGISGLMVLPYLLMPILFAYSIICGILCLKENNNALKLSLSNQILQFLNFAVCGFAFDYVAGIFCSIGVDLSNSVDFKFNVGLSKLNLSINNEPEKIEICINIVALYLIIWIDKLIRKTKLVN